MTIKEEILSHQTGIEMFNPKSLNDTIRTTKTSESKSSRTVSVKSTLNSYGVSTALPRPPSLTHSCHHVAIWGWFHVHLPSFEWRYDELGHDQIHPARISTYRPSILTRPICTRVRSQGPCHAWIYHDIHVFFGQGSKSRYCIGEPTTWIISRIRMYWAAIVSGLTPYRPVNLALFSTKKNWNTSIHLGKL